jgi:hypothetical protein
MMLRTATVTHRWSSCEWSLAHAVLGSPARLDDLVGRGMRQRSGRDIPKASALPNCATPRGA